MSCLRIDLYARPSERAAEGGLRELFALLERNRLGEVARRYPAFWSARRNARDAPGRRCFFGSEIAEGGALFAAGSTVFDVRGGEDGDVCRFGFETDAGFDAEGFLVALHAVEESDIEAAILDESRGERVFVRNLMAYGEHAACDWQWLEDPSTPALAGERVALTGALRSMADDDAAGAIEQAGGVFERAVGDATTLLVVGDGPERAMLERAVALGIPRADERRFVEMLDR